MHKSARDNSLTKFNLKPAIKECCHETAVKLHIFFAGMHAGVNTINPGKWGIHHKNPLKYMKLPNDNSLR